MKHTLDSLYKRASTLFSELGQLRCDILKNEKLLIPLNEMDDDLYRELRFISDYLRKEAENLEELRNYGKSE
jgi:hypothetical protein